MNDIELFVAAEREEQMRAFWRAELAGVTREQPVAQSRTRPGIEGWRTFFAGRNAAGGMQLERPAYLG